MVGRSSPEAVWAGYKTFAACPESVLPYRTVHVPLFHPGPLALSAAREPRPALHLEWINEPPLPCRPTEAGLLVAAPSWERELYGLDARR